MCNVSCCEATPISQVVTICFEILRKLEAGREELQTLREEKSLSFSSFQSHTAEPPVTLRGERILGNYERRRLTCWRQTHEERVSCEPGGAFSCQVTLWEQVSHPLRLSLISEETRCHRRFLLIRPRHLQHQPLPHTPNPPTHTHTRSFQTDRSRPAEESLGNITAPITGAQVSVTLPAPQQRHLQRTRLLLQALLLEGS